MLQIRDSAPCWCGASAWKVQLYTQKFGLLHCQECETSRIDPRPLCHQRSSSRFYSAYYDERLGSVQRGNIGKKSRFWKVVEQVKGLEQVGCRAFDFGCGDGTLCAELAQHGWPQVYGLDVSKSRVNRARQRFPELTFIDCPLAQARLPEESFDLIVADNVVEHLPQPLDEVRQCGALLSETGRLVLITPNLESGNFQLLGRYWSAELAPHVHIYLFRPGSMARLVEAAGLEVEAVGSFQVEISRPRFDSAKSLIWTSMQAAGDLYSRVLRSGAMVYAVARRRRRRTGSANDSGSAGL